MAKKANLGERPTKLSPELTKRLCALLYAGNYVETAAAACGIAKKTYYDWLRKGARDRDARKQTALAKFSHAIEKAMADSEVRDLKLIDRTAQEGVWQAAAWKLERRFPNRWGNRARMEVNGPESEPVEVEVVEARKKVAALIESRAEELAAAKVLSGGNGSGARSKEYLSPG